MRSGPKPIPRNLRIVRGTRDRQVDKPLTPVVEPPVKIPMPPDYLLPDEVDVFVVAARKLANMRVMTEADVDALVIYCRNWIDAQTARKRLTESGGMIVKSPSGYPIVNPYLSVARKAEDRCVRIMAEFGLTPSSRNRVSK